MRLLLFQELQLVIPITFTPVWHILTYLAKTIDIVIYSVHVWIILFVDIVLQELTQLPERKLSVFSLVLPCLMTKVYMFLVLSVPYRIAVFLNFKMISCFLTFENSEKDTKWTVIFPETESGVKNFVAFYF